MKTPLKFLLFSYALTFTLTACGGTSRRNARDTAADEACRYFERCGQVGAGQTYSDGEDCRIKQRAFLQEQWSEQRCEDKVDEDNFNRCINEIKNAQCGNGLDFLSALLKCTVDQVCPVP